MTIVLVILLILYATVIVILIRKHHLSYSAKRNLEIRLFYVALIHFVTLIGYTAFAIGNFSVDSFFVMSDFFDLNAPFVLLTMSADTRNEFAQLMCISSKSTKIAKNRRIAENDRLLQMRSSPDDKTLLNIIELRWRNNILLLMLEHDMQQCTTQFLVLNQLCAKLCKRFELAKIRNINTKHFCIFA